MSKLELGSITVDVTRKDIKNVHLSVYPPAGEVRISAPLHMNPDTIRVFAISKLPWIRQQRAKLQAQQREAPREFLDRESHVVWGQRYLLRLSEHDVSPTISLRPGWMEMSVRPGTTVLERRTLLDNWYRAQIRLVAPPLIAKWEAVLDVKICRFFVQRMKTKWGSCSPNAQNIRLNTELAQKMPECLDYIVLHEMVHLVERRHNDKFYALVELHMPNWKHVRRMLNEAPLSDVDKAA